MAKRGLQWKYRGNGQNGRVSKKSPTRDIIKKKRLTTEIVDLQKKSVNSSVNPLKGPFFGKKGVTSRILKVREAFFKK